jgi:hypothetical protein
MSTTDTITPYKGPMEVHAGPLPKDPEQAAKVMSDAAVKFSSVFNEYERAIKKGTNPLDEVTATNLNELKRQMRSTPPKPATVINLNPMDLEFGATNLYMRGIKVPACNPGMPYSKYHIRHWRHESFYLEGGERNFRPILPIHMAAEFVREFSHKDNYGGGVIVCEGEINPEKLAPDFEVETYDQMGRPITMDRQGVEYDEENHAIATIIQTPVRRRLHDLITESRSARNAFYRKQVRKAERDYRLPDGRGKANISEVHLLMAQVLHADGELPVMPDWNLTSRMEQGLSDHNCKACGNVPREGAYKCQNCGNILNALEAYKDFAIEFDHAKMAMLTSDELEEAELVRMEREESKKPSDKKSKK